MSSELAGRAAQLAAALDKGELTSERLELAAYCGYAPARACLGGPGDDDLVLGDEIDDLRAWGLGLERWQAQAIVRACVAAAAVSLREWTAVCPDDTRPQRLLGLAVDWLASEAEIDTKRASREANDFHVVVNDMDLAFGVRRAAYATMEAARSAMLTYEPYVADYYGRDVEFRHGYSVVNTIGYVLYALDFDAADGWVEGTLAQARTHLDRIGRGIADALVPWALGEGDPVQRWALAAGEG